VSAPTISPITSDPELEQGEGRKAHIVKREGVTDAYVFGNPVEALCGYVWVPSRDPKQYPLCDLCKEIAEKAWGEGSSDRIE
jgi:hypothetical protein